MKATRWHQTGDDTNCKGGQSADKTLCSRWSLVAYNTGRNAGRSFLLTTVQVLRCKLRYPCPSLHKQSSANAGIGDHRLAVLEAWLTFKFGLPRATWSRYHVRYGTVVHRRRLIVRHRAHRSMYLLCTLGRTYILR